MLSKVIPVYAKEFKNEYLLILRINDELKYFIDNINEATRGLFNNPKVDKIRKNIKRFIIEQNTSNFEIKSSDIKNLIKIKNIFNDFNRLINYKKEAYLGDEQNLFIHILVLEIFMMISNYFVVSLK